MPKCKGKKKKEVEVDELETEPFPEPSNIPVTKARPATLYDNPLREQHVERWINESVTPDPVTFIPVKCLKEWQMKYVLHNHEEHTAQQMADHLEVNVLFVKLFCQANAITPLPAKVRKTQKKAA